MILWKALYDSEYGEYGTVRYPCWSDRCGSPRECAAQRKESRHNEKNIDKLDRDLKDFRYEVLKQFEKVDEQFIHLEAKVDQRLDKVDQRINQLETKVDQRFDKINDRFNQLNMLLIAIVGLIITVIVKLIAFN